MLADALTTTTAPALNLKDYVTPEVVLLAGAALFLYGMIRWQKNRTEMRRKQQSQGTGAASAPITPTELRATAHELHSLLADLNDMSRQIAAQIDNRYMKLEATMQEADKKIKHLECLLAQVEQYTVDPGVTPHQDAISPPQYQPEPTVEPAKPAVKNEVPILPEMFIAEQQRTGMTSTYTRIYDLSDRGHTLHEIAQQVHMQPGEVDLILKLRPVKKTV